MQQISITEDFNKFTPGGSVVGPENIKIPRGGLICPSQYAVETDIAWG